MFRALLVLALIAPSPASSQVVTRVSMARGGSSAVVPVLGATANGAPFAMPSDGTILASPLNGVLPLTALPTTVSVPSSFVTVAPVAAVPASRPSVPRVVVVPVPLKSLAESVSVLAKAAANDRPVSEGRSALETFYSAASEKPQDSASPVPGSEGAAKPGLTPATPVSPKPAVRVPLKERWRAVMADGAGPLALAAFAWNFLAIGAYSIIGPARGALLMTKFGPETLPWVYMASAALTGVVVFVYGRFTRAPRRYLIGGSLVLLAATLAGGAVAVAAAASPAVSFGYFLWTDVFGIMSTTLFWTYANDVFRQDESKRLFGFLAAGAPLGSIAGAWVMKSLVGTMGPVPMLLVAAGVFAAVIPVFLFMEARAKGRGAKGADERQAAPRPAKGVLRTILASPFLVFLTLIVALERLVPDITNFLYSSAAAAAYATDAKGMAQLFADVNFWTAVASFFVSSVLTGLTLKRIGIAGSLMTAGLVNLGLFLLFPLHPLLGVASLFFALDGVARYTWFKTAKETTYSATDKDTIYRVKAFVEMFVYRFARGLAGLLLLTVAALGGGAAAAAWVGVPLALVWLYASWRVGREHAKLEKKDQERAGG